MEVGWVLENHHRFILSPSLISLSEWSTKVRLLRYLVMDHEQKVAKTFDSYFCSTITVGAILRNEQYF